MSNGLLTILTGDALEQLRTLPDESVHCCVTSPPYWGLRDYKIPPTVWGGDPTCEHDWQDASWKPDRWGEHDDETPGAKQVTNGGSLGHRGAVKRQAVCSKCGAWLGCHGLEPTPELFVQHEVLIFREVRRVLREDATLWLNLGDSYASTPPGCSGVSRSSTLHGQESAAYRETLRNGCGQKQNTIVGGLKPKDLVGIPWRVAFSLQADGWYLRSDIIWHKPNPMPESVTDRPTKSHEYLFLLAKSERYYYDVDAIRELQNGWRGSRFDDERDLTIRPTTGRKPRQSSEAFRNGQMRRSDLEAYGLTRGTSNPSCEHPNGRNKRSVWTIPTDPYSEAHFATFPPDLIKPCILAGCPAGGTVLDPFFGSGTTGMVSLELGRKCVGIELNPDYVKLAEDRCNVTPGFQL